jgi:hypothetical protein
VNRFLLCRPQGGLNDILTQIEGCCRYAEQTDRIVVVDTNYRNTRHFKDRLDKYFVSSQSRLLLAEEQLTEDLDQLHVYPEFLSGRVNAYTSVWNKERTAYCDTETGQPIRFDFSKDYPHRLLVHHQPGGQQISMFAMLRMTVQKSLIAELTERLGAIGRPYCGLHVRHTDYRSNYAEAIDRYRRSSERLFLATDNKGVVDDFRSALGADRVWSFAGLPANGGRPIHVDPAPGADVFRLNSDSILDLLMLALSNRIHVVEVENSPWGKYSGFSLLAMNLWQTKTVLRHVLACPEIRTGLD